jgi:hypothetical protein
MSEKEVSEFVKGLKKPNKSFEDQWLAKLSKSLDETVSKDIGKKVLQGSEKLAVSVNQQEIIAWTEGAMDRLDALVGYKDRRKIMTECACHFPEKRLLPLTAKYEETKDLDTIHRMLRELFISDLKNVLKLDDGLIKNILSWGWGVAGVKRGNTVIATKMPFELKEHLEAKDAKEKRYHYCHCPRIREAIRSSKPDISTTYCYCGAGFYKDIWEKILQQPVEVEVLETVLSGADVCRIAIHLPPSVAHTKK